MPTPLRSDAPKDPGGSDARKIIRGSEAASQEAFSGPPSTVLRPCRAVKTQIPKQVRDDSEWLFRKRPIPSFRQSSWSESRYYCFTILTKNEEQILALE